MGAGLMLGEAAAPGREDGVFAGEPGVGEFVDGALEVGESAGAGLTVAEGAGVLAGEATPG
jgi:hypothetical protein